MKASWLIFSRDRACQLDLLLRSIEEHALHLFQEVTVLYRASDAAFHAGYEKLIESGEAAWLVDHWKQEDAPDMFEMHTRVWLGDKPPGDRIGFLVDDDVFFAPAPDIAQENIPYSLRLGLNTTFQHPTGLDQAPPPNVHIANGRIYWNWQGAQGDFGYPLSLDGHIYRRSTVSGLLDFSFGSPTQLEAGLASRAGHFWPTLYTAAEHSCLVSVPANRVTEGSSNPVMADGPSVAELNVRWLAGERIALSPFNTATITAAHQEVKYLYDY
jgi:hypothetical protein